MAQMPIADDADPEVLNARFYTLYQIDETGCVRSSIKKSNIVRKRFSVEFTDR